MKNRTKIYSDQIEPRFEELKKKAREAQERFKSRNKEEVAKLAEVMKVN